MSHTSSCALKPNPHLSNLHHTYQNGPIKTRVVIYDVIITWSSLSTNQCLKYGSNKVTIVQIFFLRQVSITSLLRRNDVTKKPKFDSRAVNIFNWLWITFLSVIQPRLLLISVPWSSRHLNNCSLSPPVSKKSHDVDHFGRYWVDFKKRFCDRLKILPHGHTTTKFTNMLRYTPIT